MSTTTQTERRGAGVILLVLLAAVLAAANYATRRYGTPPQQAYPGAAVGALILTRVPVWLTLAAIAGIVAVVLGGQP